MPLYTTPESITRKAVQRLVSTPYRLPPLPHLLLLKTDTATREAAAAYFSGVSLFGTRDPRRVSLDSASRWPWPSSRAFAAGRGVAFSELFFFPPPPTELCVLGGPRTPRDCFFYSPSLFCVDLAARVVVIFRLSRFIFRNASDFSYFYSFGVLVYFFVLCLFGFMFFFYFCLHFISFKSRVL